MYQSINLAALPSPSAVQVWSFQAILDAASADAVSRLSAAGIAYNVQTLKGNPMNFILSAYADREGLVLQQINEAVNSTFLSAATQMADVTLRAADVNLIPAPGETVASLKNRAQLQWEALSIGGTYGRYRSNALNAAPVDLGDVGVFGAETSPVPPGQVWIVCLGANSSGVPSSTVLAAVLAACSARGARPVNDQVVVQAANLLPYSVDATLILQSGADPAAVVAAQTAALNAFAASRRMIGGYVTPEMIAAVLAYSTDGLVYDIVVNAPSAQVGGGPFDAPILTGARVVSQPRPS
ncbi:baseplate J/gp47 family protein [Rhodoblastus sp.]|uniref:baseplate J/gp47 family protein n=1 Tax=Rhodoblastus sp. TaxID=1962975 RepID=UPI003F9598D4